MAGLAKSEVVVVPVRRFQNGVTDVSSSDSGTFDIAVVVIIVMNGLNITVWEGVIADAETTAEEVMT